MRSFLKVSSEFISYFSRFLKMPESMTLSVLLWLILLFFCSKFSDILLTLPLIWLKSYYNFLNLFSRPIISSEFKFPLELEASSRYCSIFPLICLIIMSSSIYITSRSTFLCFSFSSFLARKVALCLRFSTLSLMDVWTLTSISVSLVCDNTLLTIYFLSVEILLAYSSRKDFSFFHIDSDCMFRNTINRRLKLLIILNH